MCCKFTLDFLDTANHMLCKIVTLTGIKLAPNVKYAPVLQMYIRFHSFVGTFLSASRLGSFIVSEMNSKEFETEDKF